MLHIPQKGRWLTQHNVGSVGTTTPGTSVTTGSTSTTKGTPAEIFSSTNFDACLIEICASNYFASSSDSRGCLDILIGAATESVLIADLLIGGCGGYTGANGGPKIWRFPLYIPSGSRIAAQAAGIRVSTAFQVQMRLYGGIISPPFRVGGRVDTYGVTVPDGTTITSGASGAEGSWTQITASSSRDHFCLVPSFQLGNDTTINSRGLSVDVGVGAATEEEIGPSYLYVTGTSESLSGPWGYYEPMFVDVPSGTRLAMRASCSGTVDAYAGALHGVS